MTYLVDITETLVKTISVEASCEDDAIEEASRRFHYSEVVLDNTNFKDVDFEIRV